MTNLERAIVLYERINDAFVAYGEVPQGMIEDLKDICEDLTDEEWEEFKECIKLLKIYEVD